MTTPVTPTLSPRQKAIRDAATWAANLAGDRGRLLDRKRKYRRRMRDLNEQSGGDRHELADEKRVARARYFAVLARLREIDGTGPGEVVLRAPSRKAKAEAAKPEAKEAEPEAKPKRERGFRVVLHTVHGTDIAGRDAGTEAKARDVAMEAMGANADITHASIVGKKGVIRLDRDAQPLAS